MAVPSVWLQSFLAKRRYHPTDFGCATGLHISVRVSAGAPRRNFALPPLAVHPGCTNTASPALQILRPDELARTAYWPGAGRRTHTVVKCPFNRSRIVQPVCTNAHVMRPGAPSLAATDPRKPVFYCCHIFALYSPTIQQSSRAGQGSFCRLSWPPYRAGGQFSLVNPG